MVRIPVIWFSLYFSIVSKFLPPTYTFIFQKLWKRLRRWLWSQAGTPNADPEFGSPLPAPWVFFGDPGPTSFMAAHGGGAEAQQLGVSCAVWICQGGWDWLSSPHLPLVCLALWTRVVLLSPALSGLDVWPCLQEAASSSSLPTVNLLHLIVSGFRQQQN